VQQASTTPVTDGGDSVTLITASRRYLIPIADLGLGMFVAELDRPWLDTPFLLQGFLADSQVEIDTLRKYCSYVYVDLELSNPDVADAIRRAEVRDPAPSPKRDAGASGMALEVAPQTEPMTQAPRPRPATTPARGQRIYKTRSDVRISSDTRQRFRQLVRATAGPRPADDGDGPVGRLLGWLLSRLPGGRRRAPRASERDRSSRDAIRAWLPPGVELTRYEETRTMQHELPRARGTFAHAEDVLKAVANDVKVGRIPQIAEVASAVDDMVASMIDHPDALMWVGRMRDEDVSTYNHAVKVALYLIALGRQLGFPKKELCHLGLIGMLADVGKIKLPRALLDKPGMLAPSEFGLIKEHVRLGLDALRAAGGLPIEVENGIAQHHERLDGSGYPKGLKGSEISVYGRMAAIADSFAALITPRAYANPSAPQDALMNLYEWAGTSFHEPLVEQFVQAVGVFPVGSLVELSSGEVAIVVAHNRVRRLEPKVLVLTGPDKSPLAEPIERDLLIEGKAARARIRIVRGLATGAYGLKVRDYYLSEAVRTDEIAA
jgi:HD-GYP domain-containing protein (c-di-GMP phosphodiesterase class II)